MARFNRFLRGWLGLLDAKVGGFTPSDTAEFVQPGLDAFPFVYAQMREVVWGTASIVAAGEGFNSVGPLLLVPQDQIWLIQYASVHCTAVVDSADRLVIAPAVETTTHFGLPRHVVLGTPRMEVQVGLAHMPASTLDRPYIALPGDQLGIWVTLAGETVGLPDPIFVCHIARCQI